MVRTKITSGISSMGDVKLTPSLLSMLERIEQHSGTLLMLAVTASGGQHGKLNELRGVLKACGEIDAVAENILAIDQNVAKVDANAPIHPAFVGNPSPTRPAAPPTRGAYHGRLS